MQVAYLILAHGNPEQLARLVAALPATSPVLVHFDRRSDDAHYRLARDLLGRRRDVTFVDRHACRWGDIGIVQGTLSLTRALAERSNTFDYAMLVSGADYPIKSNAEIAAYLAARSGKEFIESFPFDEPNPWSKAGGYYKIPEKVLARHLRFRSRVFRLPGMRPPPLGMRLYGGAQWWCLSRDAIQYINEFVGSHPDLIGYFSRSFIPDESFIQTILSNSPFADLITGDNLRLIVWDRPVPPYPAILKMDDLAMLLSSSKLFARKFDPRVDGRILDALDQRNAAMKA